MEPRRSTPMLYMLLPLIVGVAASNYIEFATLLSLIVITLSTIIFLLGERHAIYPLIVGFGLLVGSLNGGGSIPTSSYDRQFVLVAGEGRTACVVAQRDGDESEWHPMRLKVTTSGCSVAEYSAIVCRGAFAPYLGHGAQSNSYTSLMSRRGYRGNISIEDYTPLDATSLKVRVPLRVRMNRWALRRLISLGLSDRSFASAAAMGLARRNYLDGELIESYRISGTSHILALSGLHFGVVLLIVSSITYLLPLLRNGHLLGDTVSIIAIWLFAVMAGLGESVLRAALMFSLLHLASILSRRYNTLNSLFVAATLIILFDPAALFDVGFQLSFVAVLSIITIGVPLTRRLSVSSYLLRSIISSVVMGVVVTTATAPLLAYYFGSISLLSPIATLPCLVTLSIVVLATTIWVIAPIPLIAPPLRGVLEVAITIQNYVIESIAMWGWGYYELQISRLDLALAYLFMVVLLLLIGALVGEKGRHTPSKI